MNRLNHFIYTKKLVHPNYQNLLVVVYMHYFVSFILA